MISIELSSLHSVPIIPCARQKSRSRKPPIFSIGCRNYETFNYFFDFRAAKLSGA